MTVKLYQVEIPQTSQTNWCNGADLLPAVWEIKHRYYAGWDDLDLGMDSFVGKLVMPAVRDTMRTPGYEVDGIPSVRELRSIAAPNQYGHSFFITICYNKKYGHLVTYGGKGGDDGRVHWSCYMD